MQCRVKERNRVGRGEIEKFRKEKRRGEKTVWRKRGEEEREGKISVHRNTCSACMHVRGND